MDDEKGNFLLCGCMSLTEFRNTVGKATNNAPDVARPAVERLQSCAGAIVELAWENIELHAANERLHKKLGETIDECSALRHKLDKALDD